MSFCRFTVLGVILVLSWLTTIPSSYYSFLMCLPFSLVWRYPSNTLCSLSDLVMHSPILLLSWIFFSFCHPDRKVSVIIVAKVDKCHFKPFWLLKFLLKEQLLLWYFHLYCENGDFLLWLPINFPWLFSNLTVILYGDYYM